MRPSRNSCSKRRERPRAKSDNLLSLNHSYCWNVNTKRILVLDATGCKSKIGDGCGIFVFYYPHPRLASSFQFEAGGSQFDVVGS